MDANLDQFLEQLLIEKGITDLDDDVRAEVKANMAERILDQIDQACINALSEEKAAELAEKIVDENFHAQKSAKKRHYRYVFVNRKYKNGFSHEDIFKVANSRLGWYKRSSMNMVNFIISKELLETKIKDGVGLLNPLSYYLREVGI